MVPFWSWTDQGPWGVLAIGGSLWYGKVSPRRPEITEDRRLGRESLSLLGGREGKGAVLAAGMKPSHTAGLLVRTSHGLRNHILGDNKDNSCTLHGAYYEPGTSLCT